jgi:hypothetical protein
MNKSIARPGVFQRAETLRGSVKRYTHGIRAYIDMPVEESSASSLGVNAGEALEEIFFETPALALAGGLNIIPCARRVELVPLWLLLPLRLEA